VKRPQHACAAAGACLQRSSRIGRSARQDGVILIIALIALVLVTLAAVALVRSVDTGNIIAGNLAFRQGATAAGDAGTEAAIAWLQPKIGTADLYQDIPDAGYYATSQDLMDMTGGLHDPTLALVDWDFNNCNGTAASDCIRPAPALAVGAGNTLTYIINRLCTAPLDPNSPNNSCANYMQSDMASAKRGELKYGDDKRFESLPAEYYRITSRVKGPKNTISFVETLVHF
jgi:type IV pilus assembly protein PilX